MDNNKDNRFPTRYMVHQIGLNAQGGYQMLRDSDGEYVDHREYEAMRSYCVRLVETKQKEIDDLQMKIGRLESAIISGMAIVPDAKEVQS